MIILNECRINAEGRHLIIEATVENLDYFQNVFIDSVIIDTDETYRESGPSNTPIYSIKYEKEYVDVGVSNSDNQLVTNSNCKCSNVFLKNKMGYKHIRLVLDMNDLKGMSLNDHIFFIYIIATGIPSPTTPCGLDNKTTMGIAYNMRPIYNMAMSYVRELNNECEIPKSMLDLTLRLKALEFAFKTGNIVEAINLWEKLFKKKRFTPLSKPGCNCDGQQGQIW